jgi:hypothetical protein
MRHEGIREEVLFWRRLIEKWEVTRGQPVPARMHEALAAAERRLEGSITGGGRERLGTVLH